MTEEQPYDVVEQHDTFEVRHYPEHVVAEITVEGRFDAAGNKAFMPLASYINARNRPGDKVSMTAPVIQRAARSEATSGHIDAESLQQTEVSPGRYVVSFVMPAGHTEATLPTPGDERIRIRTVPAEYAAALRYSGRWSHKAYAAHEEELLAALTEAGIEVTGPLRFARYDPPWTPWFLRRNEVVAPIADPTF